MSRKMKVGISIAAVITIVALILMVNIFGNKKMTSEYATPLEIARASSYNEVTDEDSNVSNCSYVKFNSFFTRDLDGDGYAEKYDGTCNYLDKKATLYFDINVLTDGKLENGKITINGKNFNLSTTLVKDPVIKNDYISSNTNSIELNTINYGTQKLFSGTISANIGNNINNYSIENNTVTLTGTWVSTDGTQRININKTINLKADWYGKTSTTPYSYISTSHDIQSALKGDSVSLSFEVGYRETAEELLLQKQITEVTIPDFNGYAATEVTVSTQNCTYEYNEETKKLTITREAIVDNNGNITKSISRTNTYTVNVKYPLEAYESSGKDNITVSFPTTGYYYGYNNSSEEFSKENPYISQANRTFTHVWREIIVNTDRSPYFNIYVGKYAYNTDVNYYRYTISKRLPLNLYNNIETEDEDTYIVEWNAFTGNTFQNQNGIYMKENGTDKFKDTANQEVSMYDYIKTKGIYFSNISGLLEDDGWIKVYDNETNELLETFTKENWNTYNSSSPYYFNKDVKSISVETSKANENSYLYVYQIKQIDDNALVENISKEQFDSFNYIYSYLDGGLYNNEVPSRISNISNYAHYEAPVSTASLSVNPYVVSNQETKNITLGIQTSSSYYNEEKWKNGLFVIEMPEEVLEVVLNSVEINNNNVEIISYENYEENGKQYIKIYTQNEELDTFKITINADITADPRIATSDRTIKMYAINENCHNYRANIADSLDINGDANVQEKVLYKTQTLRIVAPSSLLTSQTLSEFDEKGTELVSPKIAILDKSNNDRTAKINVFITNNYSGTISETTIVGKIPFEGNTYQINGKELGSTYSVTMKNTGIVVSDVVKDVATVYYSTNETVTNDLEDSNNNWMLAEEVTDWTQIKTYAVHLGNYVLRGGENLIFSYEIEIPNNINYNDIAYSTHAAYFCLDTEDGKLRTQTEVNRLGIMIAKKYNVSLTKFKAGTAKQVSGATYKITDGTNTRTGKTDANGNITISGLYVDKEYTLKEISSPDAYLLNEDEVKFKITVDDTGNPVVNMLSGTLRNTANITNNDGNLTLNLEVEDIAKYDVKLLKTDSVTGAALKGVKFKVTGGYLGENGRVFTTNADGQIAISNLQLGTTYYAQETKADGYYLKENTLEFTLNRNADGSLAITSNSEEFNNAQIVEEQAQDKPVVNVTVQDEPIPTYSLNINKKNKKDEPLAETQFKLTSLDTGNIEYGKTDANGNIVFNGLYQFVDGKYITGEYLLEETLATEGYITDSTVVKFKAQIQDGILNISILAGEEAVVNSNADSDSITFEFVNSPIFKLTKKGDNDKLLPGAEFKLTDLNGNYVTDANGETIGDLVGSAPVNIEFTSESQYKWIQREDGTWESKGNYHIQSSTSTLTSSPFVVPEDATLTFDWSVSSESTSYDYVYYKITNVNTNSVIGGDTSSTKIGGTSYGSTYETLKFDTVSVDLAAGTYKIEFVYRKDGSQDKGLDAGFVRNVMLEGSGYYALTTDEKGEITANLPEGMYKLVEISAPEEYELPEDEAERTYYVGIGESKPEESEFKLEWSKSEAGSGFSNINDIEKTADGGYIAAGSFAGELDINQDGEVDLVSYGDLDGLVSKFDKDGNVEWYTRVGDAKKDTFNGISITADGGYIVGGYQTTTNLRDGLVIKLDASGNVEWQKNIAGTLYDEVKDVYALTTGDIVAVGRFKSTTISIDGNELTNSGNYDGFVVCYAPDGTYKWSQGINGTNNIDVTSITETSQGIVVGANFLGTINVSGNSIASTGSEDALLISYTLAGGYGWSQKIGGSSDESITDLTTDSEDNIIAVGRYSSNMTLGEDSLTVNSTGYASGLQVKYSSTGTYISNYTYGSTLSSDDELLSVTSTSDGGVLFGGYYNGSVDFDGDGTTDFTGGGYSSGIAVKLNDQGEYEWAKNVQSSSYDSVRGVAELEDGGYVLAGNYNGSLSSATDSNLLTVDGYNDSFMLKFNNVVTAPAVPQLQEIEAKNELKTFDIVTEIGENSDNERAGGSVTGTETNTPNIKLVENVKYGYDGTKQIEIAPDESYSVYSITINGEDYEFTPDENGNVTIPVFENVTQNYHIIVVFEKNLSNVLVHHYLKDRDGNYTTTKLAEDDYLTGKIDSEYITSPKVDIEGYELEKKEDGSYNIPDNATGVYTEDKIEVVYYYEEVPLNLVVHHYLEGTEDSLADDEEYTYYKGETYSVSPNNELLQEYNVIKDLTTIRPEKEITLGENSEINDTLNEDTVITYYYSIKTYEITTKVKEITISVYNENTYEYEDITVEGGNISGKDETPYETVTSGSNSVKNINIVPDEGYYIKSIKVNGVDYVQGTDYELLEDGSVLLNKFENVRENIEVEVQFEPMVGKVKVYHYIQGTENFVPLNNGETAKVVEKTGYVGNTYVTKQLDNVSSGYTFVSSSNNTSGYYAEDEVSIYYYYAKRTDLSYTVNYLEKDTNKVLHDPKTVENIEFEAEILSSNEVIDITGYEFDSVDKDKLIIDVQNNVINIYYTKVSFEYVVEYYYNGIKDDAQTVTEIATYGDQITTYTDKNKTGYKFEKVEGVPLTITSVVENNVIKVYYVTDETQTKALSYTVEYYKDGEKQDADTQTVSKTVQILEPDNLTVNKEEINTVNKYTGYRFDKTEPSEIPNTVNNGDVIKIYYVKDNFGYTVEYYYDGEIDDTQTENKTATYEEVITEYTDKNKIGYKFEKVEGTPLTITEIAANNVIKVYYVKDNFGYTVEYYYDGEIDDTQTENKTATYEDVITEYEDKNKTGYKFEKVEGTPLTITEVAENNVIKVYYVTDETQTKVLSYTVEYYKDGEKQDADTQTVSKTVQVLESDELTVNKEEINTVDKYTGYRFDKTEPSEIPNTVNNGDVIKVYYVKDNFGYRVEYYYDGVIDEEKTENKTATYEEVITEYTDKNIEGYRFEKTEGMPLTISEVTENNVIKVYYIIDDGNTKTISYTVEYYKDGEKQEADTQTVSKTVQILESDELTVNKEEINTVDKYIGYRFEKIEPSEIPETVTNGSVIKVYYVKDTFEYTVEYFYDAVRDNSKTENKTATYEEVITEYTDKNKTGYRFEKVEGTPLTITEVPENNIIKVYYVRDDFGYRVEYYYDGIIDEEKTENKTAKYGEELTKYTDKNKTGYKFEKVEGMPLTITEIVENNVIKVYYVKDSFGYKVEYYYNEAIDDSKTENKTAKYGEVITEYTDKNKTGYRFDKVEGVPLTITEVTENNVIKVYYVTDDGNTKTISYTVEYYKDGEKQEVDTQTVSKTVQILESDELTVNKEEINTVDKYIGYKFEKTEPSEIPNTVNNGDVIKVYYVKDNFGYTVEYYYDGAIDEEKTENKIATYEEVITEYTDKNKTGYKFEKVDGVPLTISNVPAANVIRVYYVKDKFKYTVEYYYDNVKDENATESLEADYKEVINTYKDKVKDNYKFDKIENLPLEISEIAENNVIKVYYVRKDSQVIVKYVDKVTGEEISESVTKTGKVNDSYDITENKKSIDGYTLVEEPESLTGTFVEGPQEKIFYYAKNTKVIVKYLEKDETPENNTDNTVLAEEVTIEGYEGKEYSAEQKEIPNYTFVDDTNNTQGTMTRDTIEVIYYYLQNTKVTVNYIDKTTGTKLEIVTEEGKVGDTYKSVAKDFEGYVLVEKPEQETVTMTKEETVLNYYYVKVSAGVIEKHIDVTTNEILDTKVHEGTEGTPYNILPNDYEEYYLVTDRLPENAEGTMTAEAIEVTYYYVRRMTVRVEYIDKLTGEKLAEKVEVVDENGNITYEEQDSTEMILGQEGVEYKTEEKKFDKYEIVKDMYPTNHEGIMTRIINEDGTVSSEIVVTYYYTKKATVVEKHVDINTGEIIEVEVQEGEENDPYKTEKKELEGYDIVEEKLPVNAEGEMKGETIVVYYYIKKADVVVEYIDKLTGDKIKEKVKVDGQEIYEEKDSTVYIHGHEGDAYKTEQKQFEKYKLIEIPQNATGEMKVTKNADGTENRITYVRYYYSYQSAGVIERHKDADTSELLEKETKYEGYEGDPYKTAAKQFDGYTLVKEKLPENAEGLMTRDLIEVNYYYRKLKTDNTQKPVNKDPEKPNVVTQIQNVINSINNNNNNTSKTPNTGDTEPVVAISMIILVCMTNLCQISITNQKQRIRKPKRRNIKGRRFDK